MYINKVEYLNNFLKDPFFESFNIFLSKAITGLLFRCFSLPIQYKTIQRI